MRASAIEPVREAVWVPIIPLDNVSRVQYTAKLLHSFAVSAVLSINSTASRMLLRPVSLEAGAEHHGIADGQEVAHRHGGRR